MAGRFKAVADFIHGLGMKSGLYTAKGPHTCAGFAASCNHETQDAKQWAEWGIDYVKDDSCSTCKNPTTGKAWTDTEDYGRMWQGMQVASADRDTVVRLHPYRAGFVLGALEGGF